MRSARVRLVTDTEHYSVLVQGAIAKAKVSLWIATANVKEMMLEAPVGTVARAKGRYVSILDTFSELARRGVELRFLHAGIPSRAFRTTFASTPRLASKLAMRQCPRIHMKLVAIDGRLLYLGSANFTGAGLGAKAEGRRNFEMGVLTDDDVLLDTAQARFDAVWSGRECKTCKLRKECPRPIDLLVATQKAARASKAAKASTTSTSSPPDPKVPKGETPKSSKPPVQKALRSGKRRLAITTR